MLKTSKVKSYSRLMTIRYQAWQCVRGREPKVTSVTVNGTRLHTQSGSMPRLAKIHISRISGEKMRTSGLTVTARIVNTVRYLLENRQLATSRETPKLEGTHRSKSTLRVPVLAGRIFCRVRLPATIKAGTDVRKSRSTR